MRGCKTFKYFGKRKQSQFYCWEGPGVGNREQGASKSREQGASKSREQVGGARREQGVGSKEQ